MQRLTSILASHKNGLHMAVALSAWLFLFVVWTLLREGLPHPEDASPLFYALALFLIVRAVRGLRDQALRRRYWILPALTLIFFLEEIAFGTEWGLPRYYLEAENVYIYDLKNLFTLVIELIQKWLRLADWYPDILNNLLRHDLRLLILGGGFILGLRILPAKKDVGEGGFWLLALLMPINGLLAIGALMALPADPKNVWLLGISFTRWLLIAGMAGLSWLPILLAWQRPAWIENWLVWVRPRLRRWQWIAGLLIFMGFLFQLWVPFAIRPGLDAQMQRLAPMVGWGMGALLLAWLLLEGMQGSLTRPIRAYYKIKRDFFRRHPALIYFGVMFSLLLMAQINDKGFLIFTDYIAFPKIDIADWNLWTEEVMEVAGAVEVMLAAVVLRMRAEPGN